MVIKVISELKSVLDLRFFQKLDPDVTSRDYPHSVQATICPPVIYYISASLDSVSLTMFILFTLSLRRQQALSRQFEGIYSATGK